MRFLGMPYKGIDSFEIKEECIIKWVQELRASTGRSYAYYLLKFVDWFREKGYWKSAEEMIKEAKSGDRETLERHLDILLEHIKSTKTGVRDRKNRYHAIRSFYEFYRVGLPKPSKQEINRIFQPSEEDKLRAISFKPLTLEKVKTIVFNAPQPYKTAYMVCLQGALGSSEYDQFNSYAYKQILGRLEDNEPIRVDLFRSKVSKTEIKRYYTFLGKDARALIKSYLNERPKCNLDELFVVYNRKEGKYVPLTSRLLGNMLTKVAKRVGIIQRNNLGRYHVHLHEFRDLFKSLCTIYGVNSIASEFFLGHVIDRLNYDKSPEYNEQWFREEYKKVEPVLNIISEGMAVERVREVRQELQNALEIVILENKELRDRLQRVEKALKVFIEIAKEDPQALLMLRDFLKDG